MKKGIRYTLLALLFAANLNAQEEEVGTASYYSDRYHGERTYSGQRYDKNKLTCAHKTLPMGTRLRVTWLDNGKSVEVRVNDRMSSQRRVVDLSRAAAKQLGILGRGIAKVKLEVLDEAGSEGKAAAEPEGQPTPAKGGNDDPPR